GVLVAGERATRPPDDNQIARDGIDLDVFGRVSLEGVDRRLPDHDPLTVVAGDHGAGVAGRDDVGGIVVAVLVAGDVEAAAGGGGDGGAFVVVLGAGLGIAHPSPGKGIQIGAGSGVASVLPLRCGLVAS